MHEVVTTINKGDSVQIGEMENGWAPAYLGGNPAGFFYAKLLKEKPPKRVPAVSITDWSWGLSDNEESLIWQAIIKNNTDKLIDLVECKLTTYDKNDIRINSENNFVKGLPPNDSKTVQARSDFFGPEYKATLQVVEI